MIKSYGQVWRILTRVERGRFVLLALLAFIMALFELVGVASIYPFMSILADPALVETNGALRMFAQVLGLNSHREVAIAFGIGVLVLIVVGAVVRAVVTYIQIRFALNRTYAIASRLLHAHLGRDYGWHITRNTAALSQSILSEVDMVVGQSILPSILLISNIFNLFLVGGFLVIADPAIAIGAITLLVSIYSLAFLLLRKRIQWIGQKRMEANGERFKVVQEVTGSFKDIKVMGLERIGLQRFRTPARAMAGYQAMGLIMQRLPRFALEAAVYGGFVVMVLVLVVFRGGDIADLLPILGLLALSATKLFPALQQLYTNISNMRMSEPILARLHADLEFIPDQQTRVLPEFEGPRLPMEQAITLEQVAFRYPNTERNTLDQISVAIPARASVGIVGGTGAGKTTMVDIILGLLRPDAGHITIDGTPLTPETTRAWQRNIGYVPQTIFLSDDTVAANIAFGLAADDIDLERVEKAARMANLHDFVMAELQQGYQTVVGERGLRLSGGQRQRVGIARALYHDPEVLILDEATSALDNFTEQAVMEAVRTLSGHKTIVMIAHRLSTVQTCDKILVLERGKLVAEGPYDALLNSSPEFQKLAQIP